MESFVLEELKGLMNNSANLEDINALNERLKHLLENFVQSDLVSLFVYDKDEKVLKHKMFYDRTIGVLTNIEHDNNPLSMIEPKGCIGKVFLTKSPAIYNYITSDKDYRKEYDNALEHKLKAQMIMPVIENDMLLGIVRVSTVIQGTLKKYTQKELALIKSAEPYFINIIKKLTLNIDMGKFETIDHKLAAEIELEAKQQPTVDDDSMLLFLSNTVHDIRTPANTLYGFLELVEEQIEDKRLKGFITNAKESALFINTLTDSILETTKNRYESNTSKKTIVNTIHFLSEVVNVFAAKMSEKKINYFIFLCPKLPKEIKIDTLKLKRILMNLIGNAYKFTPNNHQIDVFINYDTSSEKMRVSIKDTGIGIEEENQKKLFKAFSQARDDTSMKYGGTGLGLAISAGYVADLGGELKLKSRLNEGSEFYFDISLEVVDASLSYEPFYNLDKKIVILSDSFNAKNSEYIRNYIIELGMPEEKIQISGDIVYGMTHLICFEHKITDTLLTYVEKNNIKLLLIEEKLFSLLNNKKTNKFTIVSENTYYGDAIHSTIFSGKKIKILIVDDNKINISLLESMLETEYVEVDTCIDGETALETLKDASKKGNKYDIVYLDKYMPGISGTELLVTFRDYEKTHKLEPIFAVSITGDPNISEEEQNLFNAFVNKPFSKKEVRAVVELLKNK